MKTFAGICLGFVLSLTVIGYAEFVEEENWYGRMRMPWHGEEGGYLRDWLVLGDFPNPPHEGDEIYDQTEPCIGCDTDYLTEHGGESGILATEGMQHQRPDGTIATWFKYYAANDTVDFIELLGNRPTDSKVAYAYTELDVDEAGPALLCLGSDDGIMAWLNGELVHRHIVGRGLWKDADKVPVELKEGRNTLLVKVENGWGGWEFAARILRGQALKAFAQGSFDPTLKVDDDKLVLKTDQVMDADAVVSVTVIRAGGEEMAATAVPRGDSVTFDTADWQDGLYEIRCVSVRIDGRRAVRHLPWFKGNAQMAVQKLLDAAKHADQRTENGMITVMLADMVRDRLGDEEDALTEQDLLKVHSPLMEFEELQLEQAGETGRIRPYGFVRMAWRDPIDDTPQFCRVYLPPDYDASKQYPMAVHLHGYYGANPDYIHWWGAENRHHDRAEQYGVIYVEPHGRGNTGYQGIGEQDVLRCIEKAKQRFSVNDDQVYLSGESMGGGGAWYVASRNPEQFAAVAPIHGGWHSAVYVEEEAWTNRTEEEIFDAERDSQWTQAEALLTTPVFVNHCADDDVVAVQFSRYIVRQMQRWGYDIRYWERPTGGHRMHGDQWEGVMEWFLKHHRNTHPRQVRLRAVPLKAAAAHWVCVERYDNPQKLMCLDAELVGTNLVKLTSSNVTAVTLSPAGDLIDPDLPLTVLWNGREFARPFEHGSVTLALDDYPADTLLKRPGLSGPIIDTQRTPFIIVAGTISSDPVRRALITRVAEEMVDDWKQWQKFTPRHCTDVELTPEEMAAHSLVLIGGAEENAVTRKLQDGIPLDIEDGTVRIGNQLFEAPDAAVEMIYPNPLNSNRYVLVLAATSPMGLLYAKNAPNQYDYCIIDNRQTGTKAGHTYERILPACGHFDNAWSFSTNLLFAGDADVRNDAPALQVPTYVDASAVDEDTLYLSELLEIGKDGRMGAFNRDMNAQHDALVLNGKEYAHGISMHAREGHGSIEWNIENGGWKKLRGVIGLEFEEEPDEEYMSHVHLRFVVKGDGEELYRSASFGYGSEPEELDIAVDGVKVLTLTVEDGGWRCGRVVKSIDWADIRLESDF